jgi:16S rRNA G966 N2-methylase RsmD
MGRLTKEKAKAYIYIDPPFSIREGMEDIYDKTMNLIKGLDFQRVELIIIEHMTGLEIPEKLGAFVSFKHKKFGNTTLTYMQNENME